MRSQCPGCPIRMIINVCNMIHVTAVPPAGQSMVVPVVLLTILCVAVCRHPIRDPAAGSSQAASSHSAKHQQWRQPRAEQHCGSGAATSHQGPEQQEQQVIPCTAPRAMWPLQDALQPSVAQRASQQARAVQCLWHPLPAQQTPGQGSGMFLRRLLVNSRQSRAT